MNFKISEENKKKYVSALLAAKLVLFILTPSIFFLQIGAKAEIEDLMEGAVDKNRYYTINLDHPTILKGYTVSGFENSLKLSLVPGILSADTRVDMVELNEEMDMPWNMKKISRIFQFEFVNKQAYDNHKPFYIQFSYDEKNNDHKQVFFYDKNHNSWRPLPTRDFPKENFVRSLIHLPFARIAVFSYPGKLTTGKASWYAYKPGMFAASPDFPKGSRIRVHNFENGKFVDVVINDFGPNRSLHPDRAIDLEKNAFAALTPLSKGVTEVHLEPLYIAPGKEGSVLGVSEERGVNNEPKITVKSAMIIDGSTGEDIWSKDKDKVLPLASLTKMVAVKVFLDTNPSLDTKASYSKKDEAYNYEHCQPWESAKLSLEEGETITVEQLIYSSITGSANNTVETLVRISGLERAVFIAKMNALVREWGALSTKFVEPSGLAPENVSSAADYAIITREVLKNPIIQKASIAKEYSFRTSANANLRRLKNTNFLVRDGKYSFTGSKTGYLHEAGYCLMTGVDLGHGKSLIVVTLGADTRDRSFSETEKLIEYGRGKIRY
jgi:serine-type D-Ala-D-Ala endopeptidase (penicillin-binding protein 7)